MTALDKRLKLEALNADCGTVFDLVERLELFEEEWTERINGLTEWFVCDNPMPDIHEAIAYLKGYVSLLSDTERHHMLDDPDSDDWQRQRLYLIDAVEKYEAEKEAELRGYEAQRLQLPFDADARQIGAEYARAKRSAIETARALHACGAMLAQKKATLKHGQ